jgi:ligand-binding sensor domain-containing protein
MKLSPPARAREDSMKIGFPIATAAMLAAGGLLLSSYLEDLAAAGAPRPPPPQAHPAPAKVAAAKPTQPVPPPLAQGKAGAPGADAGFTHFRVGARNVKRILVDGATVWVGTSGGLIRYEPATDGYRLYDTRSGLRAANVIFVGKLRDRIVAGTLGGGLSVLDPATDRWSHYGAAEGLADDTVHDVLRSRSGDVWIATRAGVNRVRGGDLAQRARWDTLTAASTGGGLPHDRVYALAEGAGDEIWLATEGGLARHRAGQWQTDAAGTFIVSLAADARGQVWAGTLGGGLLGYDGSAWRAYTVRDGLPANNVLALHREASGRLWVATDKGLARLHEGRFRVMTTADGLFADAVYAVASAPGTLWAGGYGGVARIRGIR